MPASPALTTPLPATLYRVPLPLRVLIWIPTTFSIPLFLGTLFLGYLPVETHIDVVARRSWPFSLSLFHSSLALIATAFSWYALYRLRTRYYAKPFSEIPTYLWLTAVVGIVLNVALAVEIASMSKSMCMYGPFPQRYWGYLPLQFLSLLSPSFLACMLLYKVKRYNRAP